MSTQQVTGFRVYSHYIWLATFFAFLLALAIGSIDVFFFNALGQFLLMTTYMMVATSVLHAAIWSVLDSSNIVRRHFAALALLAMVACGLILGFTILLQNSGSSEYKLLFVMVVVGTIPTLAAAQIPFWILRIVFGWQLVRCGGKPVAMSIQQLLLITLAYAIAFASPSVITNLQLLSADELDIVNYEEDGTLNAEFEQIRQDEEKFIRESTRMMLMQLGIYFVALSLLALPMVWFIFATKQRRAVGFCIFYTCILLLIPGIISIFYSASLFSEVMLYSSFTIVLWSLLVSGPLLISRSKGVELTTFRKHIQHTDKTVLENSSESPDPFN